MAYAFRIHEPKKTGNPAPMSASTMAGWTETGHIAGNLLGNIDLGLVGNKMGTSIPSIFARIFLFEGAFQTLKSVPFSKLNKVDADTTLISECLDLMEFIYQHGQDPKLVIKHWNANNQILGLRSDGFAEHAKLAKVLEDEINIYPELEDIYLFFWKDSSPSSIHEQEFLIGGTSPYTMVFTSPNWLRVVKRNSFSFNRLNGKPLFTNKDVEPLKTRDSAFKEMLYSVRMAYQQQLNDKATSFNQYLTTMWNNDVHSPSVEKMAGNAGAFLTKYSIVKDQDGGDVFAGYLPLCYLQEKMTASGYEIAAKVDRFANYIAKDGSSQQINAPLALNDNGLSGVKYIGNSTWNAQICKINEAAIRNTEMHERMAPGAMGIKYPILIWSDFLEDKIIKLPYRINDKYFITAFGGDTQYILPLKKYFFKYFNVDDISNYVVPEMKKKLVEMTVNGNSVTVTINVPIHDPTYRVIEFKKTYSDSDIVSANILLGFFPFYRCSDNQKNRYNILNCGIATRLNFYNVNNLDMPMNAPSMIRTQAKGFISKTEYYTVKESIDLTEIVIDGVKGLIIPKMDRIDVSTCEKELFSFAVDFGTSNTFIAYKTKAEEKPRTMEVDERDQQVIYLNKPDRNGKLFTQGALGDVLYLSTGFLSREFLPLGKEYDVTYPMRTATCETSNFEQSTLNLFGNISIGFNLMHEPQSFPYFSYKTRLKWLLEDEPSNQYHTNRVRAYFMQTLCILKNKSMMNGGLDDFKVYITLPEAMKDKSLITNQWEWAKKELGINCSLEYRGTEFSESVAPYNCMASQIGGLSFLNIDIGGGTNDLLFVNKDGAGKIVSAYYSSAMFAGDDLWGDGIQISSNVTQNNGFVDYVMKKIDEAQSSYPKDLISSLNGLKSGVSPSSADLMGYLFKYDTIFGTSQKIKDESNLYMLIFIHYAALMYNVARLIKKMGVEIPQHISFTGMGSKYIKMISMEDTVIKNLTVLLLEKYTGKKVDPLFDIIHAREMDVKEITAKGALEGINLAENFRIPSQSLTPIVDFGFDGVQQLTYAQVQTDEVRNSVLESFEIFVNSLTDKDFKNFLNSLSSKLTVSEQLIKDLKLFARSSFITMSGNIARGYADLDVNETLFFWCLKDSLIKLSKNYAKYK